MLHANDADSTGEALTFPSTAPQEHDSPEALVAKLIQAMSEAGSPLSVWETGTPYQAGALVISAGSIWIALDETLGDEPGQEGGQFWSEMLPAALRVWQSGGVLYSASSLVLHDHAIWQAQSTHSNGAEPRLDSGEYWTPLLDLETWSPASLTATFGAYAATLNAGTLTANRALLLPDEDGTLAVAAANRAAALRAIARGAMALNIHWEAAPLLSTNISGTSPTVTALGRSLQISHAASSTGAHRVNNDGWGSGANFQFFLPGSVGNLACTTGTVNWDKPWVMRFHGVTYMGGSGAKITVQIGVISSLAAHSMADKSVGFQLAAGASNTTINLLSHNGSTLGTTASATALASTDFDFHQWELYWQPGVGLYLFLDGTLIATRTTGLPSGNGSSTRHTFQIVTEAAGSANGALFRFTGIEIAHL